MTMAKLSIAAVSAVVLTLGAICPIGSAHAQDQTIYSSIVDPLPANLPSLGFQATSTREFGDYVQFSAGSSRELTNVTVTMSNWATAANNPSFALLDPTGFTVPLTLTLYAPVGGGSNPAVGAQISQKTLNAHINWRPADDIGNCPGGGYSSGGGCFNGAAQNVTFDFSGVVVPDAVIWGLSFNTQSYGANPIGSDGPYNSLNVALSGGASVGMDVDPDSVYWNTAFPGFLTSGTPNVFGSDKGWAPYVPAAQFDAVPEPATMALLGVGMVGLGWVRRRKS